MCKNCKHLSKCLEAAVTAEMMRRALEEHEMFCPIERPELLHNLQRLKGSDE